MMLNIRRKGQRLQRGEQTCLTTLRFKWAAPVYAPQEAVKSRGISLRPFAHWNAILHVKKLDTVDGKRALTPDNHHRNDIQPQINRTSDFVEAVTIGPTH